MEFSMAPMEGITNHLYRNAFGECYSGISRYYSPFVAVFEGARMKKRDLKDIQPENNRLPVIPQLLTNNSDDCIKACKKLEELGFTEVNLNLGCPSPTVTSKGKGAAMLRDLDDLRSFLSAVYGAFENTSLKISVKSRIGITDPGEFEGILAVMADFPLKEWIIHPRVLQEGYSGKPHTEIFCKNNLSKCKFPVAYNGNIYQLSDYLKAREVMDFSGNCVNHVMLGRGLLIRPYLAENLAKWNPENSKMQDSQSKLSQSEEKMRLRSFYERLTASYQEEFPGENAVLSHLKELAAFWMQGFTNGTEYIKEMRKAKRLPELDSVFKRLLVNEEVIIDDGNLEII